MIGIVIVTHCQLGEALIEAAEFIIGERPGSLESVSIDLSENAEKLRKLRRGNDYSGCIGKTVNNGMREKIYNHPET